MNKLCSLFLIALASFVGSAQAVEGWKEFSSTEGNCKISFPSSPQHIKERMQLPHSGSWVEYDVYIAPMQKKALFVMMIAEYPQKISDEKINGCLESFLKGMVGHSDNNRLIFADITELEGKKALEFFLASDKDFFRGKTFLSDNKLFLIAVECLDEKESEDLYHIFSESFEFN